ncbi:hypothetical protein ASG36_21060 [Geodermatophilus sp. Leaf369]|uniref:glycoside hydrolase family 6 protein n=1 Tax=Geodermatophilus sp. Leaf369 TaxID=1736354 RepID=UPI0006F9AA39|nr:glycoside hydrolase family 6 protein [Geodermatophilus sp. Leaf369]KQS54124.1 hypothetical protein ASG36_21060 [Geodermatophilus sp. Leaf369]
MVRRVIVAVLSLALLVTGWVLTRPDTAPFELRQLAGGDAPTLGPGARLFGNPDAQAVQWVAEHPGDGRTPAVLAGLADRPVARWFTEPTTEVGAQVDAYVDQASITGATPVVVAYAIPDRDCGQYSSGGAEDAAAYRSWIRSFAEGIGTRRAVVVLEPDSLVHFDCLDDEQVAEREALLADATAVLADSAPRSEVFLDGSAANWSIDAHELADRLVASGIADADGIALGVSAYTDTDTAVAFGRETARALARDTGQQLDLVVDTSRNGTGTRDWCNPDGQRVGAPPTTDPGLGDDVLALLWIKPPGESDGDCGIGAGTVSGQFDPDLAVRLVG